MARPKWSGLYYPTHNWNAAQRDAQGHKEIVAIIRQRGRPWPKIPRLSKKPDVIAIWQKQDEIISASLAGAAARTSTRLENAIGVKVEGVVSMTMSEVYHSSTDIPERRTDDGAGRR